ncbi:MAG: NAD(P)-dependent oxidoreductase [Mastigocoleus sp. MO_167.B18]|nr:NAD(P)-dependent oxidoreductase [Mastigocoleus sp. MO_167.B18]
MKTLITGATGLTGTLLLQRLAASHPGTEMTCLVRPNSDRTFINSLNLNLKYYTADCSKSQTWDNILNQEKFETIIHIVQLRLVPTIINSLKKAQQTPRLIIIGTTGVYSKYNLYSAEYKDAESHLAKYTASYCLLRPTMIYGSHRDKNLHKLIKFCHRYGFFPVFGSGKNLVQPIHADDIAKTLLYVWEHSNIQGAYDISGESIINFRDLLALVGKLIDKPIHPIFLPLNFGIFSATILEKVLKKRSPVRREQILRLQEDKAYPHDAAKRDLEFCPRSLEIGLQQEIDLMRSLGII